MRKEYYIKPTTEVVRVEIESLMAASPYLENTSNVENKYNITFEAPRRNVYEEDDIDY